MGLNRYDYNGYKTQWLLKTDLTPKMLRRYSIKATSKEIKEVINDCEYGTILTGGMGNYKKIMTYSIAKLSELLKGRL